MGFNERLQTSYKSTATAPTALIPKNTEKFTENSTKISIAVIQPPPARTS